MRWNFKQNTDKYWTITNTEGNFLYGIADNNGIRVGATEDKWTITAHSENSMTWSFKNGKSRFLGVYNNSDWRSYTSLTASNFGEKGKNSQVILYYCGSISSLPSLEMPIVAAETRNTNSVYVSWNAIDGAKDYTVTCGAQSITLSGTEHTFTGLAYSTSYTISVVANPTDASVNAPSAAGTATATTGANPAGTTVTTYQHIFVSKPSIGSVSLSGVTWTLAASNIGNYNSTNYAGVQFGTKNSSGSITLTSSAWSYKEKTKITEVRVWLNAGTGTPTASVSIGGKNATSDGTVVKQNKKAKSYKDATMLTFTPVDGGDSGIVFIKASSSNAAYICAMEIDCL